MAMNQNAIRDTDRDALRVTGRRAAMPPGTVGPIRRVSTSKTCGMAIRQTTTEAQTTIIHDELGAMQGNWLQGTSSTTTISIHRVAKALRAELRIARGVHDVSVVPALLRASAAHARRTVARPAIPTCVVRAVRPHPAIARSNLWSRVKNGASDGLGQVLSARCASRAERKLSSWPKLPL